MGGPSAVEILAPLAPAGASLLAFYLMSAVTFRSVWVRIARAAGRGGRAARAFQFLRTPANLLHECSHAAGMLLAGVRVAELRFWWNDPGGQGFCRAGRPFAPWAHPWSLALVSGLAPLLAGALVLALLGDRAGLDLAVLDGGDPWRLPATTVRALVALDWTSPGPYALLLAALLLGGEAHPSATDLRHAAAPAALAIALDVLLAVAAQRVPALSPLGGGMLALHGWLARLVLPYTAVACVTLGAGLGVAALLLAAAALHRSNRQ